MDSFVQEAGFGAILDKVRANERLSIEDGVKLYKSDNILALGYMANIVRERLNSNKAYFIYNQHINYSNICTNLCKFCAFGKDKESELAYEMSVEDVKKKVQGRLDGHRRGMEDQSEHHAGSELVRYHKVPKI